MSLKLNLNLNFIPTQEEYGAQPPIELLRQWFDNGGWYDRKMLTFRQIIDVVFVCACGPPGGGRQSLSARFPRHFNTVGYTPMQVRDSASSVILNLTRLSRGRFVTASFPRRTRQCSASSRPF